MDQLLKAVMMSILSFAGVFVVLSLLVVFIKGLKFVGIWEEKRNSRVSQKS